MAVLESSAMLLESLAASLGVSSASTESAGAAALLEAAPAALV